MVIPNVQPARLMPGLLVQWTPAHDLFVAQVLDVSATTIDTWYATNADVMRKWPANEPYRALLDFSFAEQIYVTPRAKAYAERLFGLRPDLKGRMALLIRPSVAAQSVQFFVHRHSNKGVIGSAFFDRDKAMAWLAGS